MTCHCGRPIVQIDDDPYFDPEEWLHEATCFPLCNMNRLASDPTNRAAPAYSPTEELFIHA